MEDNIQIIQNQETQEGEKLTEKAKKVFEKHRKVIIGGGTVFVLVSTNLITAKITGNKAYNKGVINGISEGIEIVMNNSSMLGKGLSAFRKY